MAGQEAPAAVAVLDDAAVYVTAIGETRDKERTLLLETKGDV